jgi:hypothetical protein
VPRLPRGPSLQSGRAADSLHRYSSIDTLTGMKRAIDRPIVGVLAGYEKAGFTADEPQAYLRGRRWDWLTVVFELQPGDGSTVWGLPLERHGAWGFGGYFKEGAYAVPVGVNGQPLGQRAGFYCAIRMR